jgi:gluconolactonase
MDFSLMTTIPHAMMIALPRTRLSAAIGCAPLVAAVLLGGMSAQAEDATPAGARPEATSPSLANPLLGVGKLALVRGGYAKLDTPQWLPAERRLVFTDLEAARLYALTLPEADGLADAAPRIEPLLDAAFRCTTGPDGRLYGVLDGKLVSWRPGEQPKVIADSAADGRTLSLNDVAVSSRGFLYFSTLKDPDTGRLSIVDLNSGAIRVAWDGQQEPTLWNPNGVALSPDERFLYVGISSYAARKHSGVYRFAIADDGSLDVAAGKPAPWAAVAGPDGIAVDRNGNVYFTAGGKVEVFAPDGRRWGTLTIPKLSGTNLGFGGDDRRTLFVTTNQALYQVRVNTPGTLP